MKDDEGKPEVVDFREWIEAHLTPPFISMRELGAEAVVLVLRALDEHKLLDIFRGFSIMYNHQQDKYVTRFVFDDDALEARGWYVDDRGNIVKR